jgi:hypothetical protein
MQTFSFTIYIEEADITDEQADKLYEIAPDATIGVHCGEVEIHFDREGTFEEPTINEAIKLVKDIGLTPIGINKEIK